MDYFYEIYHRTIQISTLTSWVAASKLPILIALIESWVLLAQDFKGTIGLI